MAGNIPSVGTFGATPSQGPAALSGAVTSLFDPQAKADRATKLSETKAVGAQAESANVKANDDMLSTLLRGADSSPQFAQSPLFKKALENRMKQIGLPVPTTADGQVDMEALKHYANPTKPFSQWTPDEIKKVESLKPEYRNLPADAPDRLKKDPAIVPLTSTGEQAIYHDVQAKLALLAEGKETAGGVLAAIQSAKQRMAQSGESTGALDQYLSDDGTNLNPVITDQLSSDFAQATIKRMEGLTSIAVDKEKLAKQIADEKKREFNATGARKDRALGQADQKIRDTEAKNAVDAQRKSAETAQGWKRITETAAYHKFTQDQQASRFEMAQLKTQLAPVQRSYSQALTQLEANKRAMAQGAHGKDILENTAQLQEMVNSLGPQLSQMEAKVSGQPATNMTLVTGQKSTVTSTPDSSPTSGGGKVANRSDVIRIGKGMGLSEAASIKDAESHGYTVR